MDSKLLPDKPLFCLDNPAPVFGVRSLDMRRIARVKAQHMVITVPKPSSFRRLNLPNNFCGIMRQCFN